MTTKISEKFGINRLFLSKDNKKRFIIVKVGSMYVSKEVLIFDSPLGGNSVGNERTFSSWEEAINTEVQWLES